MELTEYKLGELITQRREKKPVGEDIPIRGVSKDGFIPPKQIEADTDIYNVFYKNDFVYNPARMELGSIAFNDVLEKGICSSLYEVFYVHKTEIINPEYLAIFVSQKEFARYCNFLSSGSAREYCRFANISEIKILLPSIERQNEIVHDYKIVLKRINVLDGINKNLISFMQCKYDEMFNKYLIDKNLLLPDGWKWANLGNYADLKSGYAFKSDWWQNSGVKVLKIANIYDNFVDIENCDCVSIDNVAKASEYEVFPGDILIAMTGATTGKIGLVPYTKEKLYANQRAGKFYLGSDAVHKVPFLYCTLLNSIVSKKLKPDGMAGSAQDNISADFIKSIDIVIPTKSILADFNISFEPFVKTIMYNCSEISKLNNLKELIFNSIK